MMCIRHNRWYRVGEKCPFCEREKKDIELLDYQISQIQKELDEPIVLWEFGY